MAAKALPEAETLRKLFNYDPETGKLFWEMRPEADFSSSVRCAWWNSLYAGRETFTAVHPSGYCMGSVHGKTLLKHRVIWCLMTGAWPETVDHINGDKSDNRWSNLRDVSLSKNLRNQKKPINNTSGHVGVVRAGAKWKAQIWLDGKSVHLGTYEQKDDAIAARRLAEQEHGFHANHGRNAAGASAA